MRIAKPSVVFLARLALFALLTSSAVGCDPSGYPPYDRVRLLRETTDMLILPAFADAATRAGTLRTATMGLCATPNATTLAAARTAWIDSFVAYHGTIAYQLGTPPRTAHFFTLPTWPADLVAVEGVVTGTAPIDAAFVDALPTTNYGYAALEYFLFAYPRYAGANDAMTLAALANTRRCTYAATVADRIARISEQVNTAWSPTGGNYADVFVNATDATIYSSPQAAVGFLINQIDEAIDKVRDDRLGRPLGRTVNTGPIQSPYAHASVAAMEACYAGAARAWSAPPHGLDAFLRTRNTMLADTVLAQFRTGTSTLAALESPPLTPAWETYANGTAHVAGNPAYVAGDAAYDGLRALQALLESDVGSTLGLSVTRPNDQD